MTEWPGKNRAIRWRITSSASRSARVTGVASALVSTATSALKYASVRRPAMYAASVATESRSWRGGLGRRAPFEHCLRSVYRMKTRSASGGTRKSSRVHRRVAWASTLARGIRSKTRARVLAHATQGASAKRYSVRRRLINTRVAPQQLAADEAELLVEPMRVPRPQRLAGVL